MAFPRSIALLVAIASGTTSTFSGATEKEGAATIEFRQVKYFHRWSQGTQHEFTPAKQEDLDHWTDMITINGYPGVDDGDELAAAANAVLGNYQRSGKVLATRSVPRTSERPAEHFISVMFVRPKFVEVAFARFKLSEGKGYSMVYSHRIYAEDAAEEMKSWTTANGPAAEKALMEWNSLLGPIVKKAD